MKLGFAAAATALLVAGCGAPHEPAGNGSIPGEASLRAAAVAYVEALGAGECARAVALTSGERAVVTQTQALCSRAGAEGWSRVTVVSDSFRAPVEYLVSCSALTRQGALRTVSLMLESDLGGFRVHALPGEPAPSP